MSGEISKGIDIIAQELVKRDFMFGPLQSIVNDNCDAPEEVRPFLAGVETGISYALKMIISDKLDLRVIEKE